MTRRHLLTALLGTPLPSAAAAEKRLDKVRALAVLSPDALASVAYANQEIFLGLAVAGAAGLAYAGEIALVISVLLALVALSYTQTIAAYPTGGGSYAVARENLGTLPGLVAAAALLISYVLNAAVSLTAGVEAVSSAFPGLWPYRTLLALALLLLITLVNLRGLQEAGTVMIVPIYLFLGTYLGLIAFGLMTTLGEARSAVISAPAQVPVTPFLLMRTFAAGTTALTGVEAISNAVPAFRPPEIRNAQRTMAVMALLMGALFLGTNGLIEYLGVVAGVQETILSALARRLWGSGFFYFLAQFSVLLVLVVAANTSFAGFPRVAVVLAQDKFMPRQLQFLGDRLVFANGIILLSTVAGLLIVLFGGDAHRLIPLFAVGAFLAFTLSQTGMVRHWLRERSPRWQVKATLNGLGAVATGVALLVIASSRFLAGAWIALLLIPLLVLAFRSVHDHYDEVGRELRLPASPPALQRHHPRIVMPVAGVHQGVLAALSYACSIAEDVQAVYVEIEPGTAEVMRARWQQHGLDDLATLVVVPSPYRSLIGPFLDYLDRIDAEADDGWLATVLIPEFVPARWWHNILHNQSAWLLRLALLYRRHHLGKSRAIIDVPFYLER